MKLLFKLGVWKASIESRKVLSTHVIQGRLVFLQCNVQRIIDDPHAANTCPIPNRLAVSGAVAANKCERVATVPGACVHLCDCFPVEGHI